MNKVSTAAAKTRWTRASHNKSTFALNYLGKADIDSGALFGLLVVAVAVFHSWRILRPEAGEWLP